MMSSDELLQWRARWRDDFVLKGTAIIPSVLFGRLLDEAASVRSLTEDNVQKSASMTAMQVRGDGLRDDLKAGREQFDEQRATLLEVLQQRDALARQVAAWRRSPLGRADRLGRFVGRLGVALARRAADRRAGGQS